MPGEAATVEGGELLSQMWWAHSRLLTSLSQVVIAWSSGSREPLLARIIVASWAATSARIHSAMCGFTVSAVTNPSRRLFRLAWSDMARLSLM